MVCLEAKPQLTHHVIFSRRGYIVPRRDGRLLAGSTSENAGFDKSVTAGVFWGEVRVMLAKEWRLCIYTIILMTVCGTKGNDTLLVRMRTDNIIV